MILAERLVSDRAVIDGSRVDRADVPQTRQPSSRVEPLGRLMDKGHLPGPGGPVSRGQRQVGRSECQRMPKGSQRGEGLSWILPTARHPDLFLRFGRDGTPWSVGA